MKIRMMPDGMFYDFDNGLTLSVQYGKLSYCTFERKVEHGVNYRVISEVDIAVLRTATNELVQIHRYEGEYQAAPYFPVSLLPEAMVLVQQSKLKELSDLVHKHWDDSKTDNYKFSKEDADDAIARG